MPTYIARVGPRYVKIGSTNDVRRRLDQLANGATKGCATPDDLPQYNELQIIALYDGAYLEPALHIAFADLRVIGEWYRYEGRLVDLAASSRRRLSYPDLPYEVTPRHVPGGTRAA